MRYFGFLLAGLFIFPTATQAQQTLRLAAPADLLVGGAIATQDLDKPELAQLIATQFDVIAPEYEMMPDQLADNYGHFDFAKVDRIVDYTEKNGQPILGHMLLWHFESRQWLFEMPNGKSLPREQALAHLKLYIDTVVGRYKGRIRAWNVVNEAISDKDGEYLRDTPALRAIGPDYIQKAFDFAHAADPNAELYYNDYNIEQPAKLEKTLRLVRALQAHKVRLDAVGIQGHWLLDYPSTETIKNGIEALSKTGVKVMITELDVDVLPREVSGYSHC